jgi:hypothetical protein
LPGEKDPTQAISICPLCNSSVSQDATYCVNCNNTITPEQGRPHPRKTPKKDERYKEYGPKNTVINPAIPIMANKIEIKNKEYAKHDKKKVKDTYESEEFNMCKMPKNKNNINDDIDKNEIMRSCIDLAIDG